MFLGTADEEEVCLLQPRSKTPSCYRAQIQCHDTVDAKATWGNCAAACSAFRTTPAHVRIHVRRTADTSLRILSVMS